MNDKKNAILKKHRDKRKSAGWKYIQVSMDSEALQMLEALRKELCMRWRTSAIIRKALILFYKETFKNR